MGQGQDQTSGSPEVPDWWEDPGLAAAVAESEAFVAELGWDTAPRLFALVRTESLIAADPSLRGTLDAGSEYTPIAQDDFLAGDLESSIAGVSWPDAVDGCVLVREIVILPPSAANEVNGDTERAAEHPERREARLAAGVLRDRQGGACLMRLRPAAAADPGTHPEEPLRGADLAPGLVQALHATFR